MASRNPTSLPSRASSARRLTTSLVCLGHKARAPYVLDICESTPLKPIPIEQLGRFTPERLGYLHSEVAMYSDNRDREFSWIYQPPAIGGIVTAVRVLDRNVISGNAFDHWEAAARAAVGDDSLCMTEFDKRHGPWLESSMTDPAVTAFLLDNAPTIVDPLARYVVQGPPAADLPRIKPPTARL